MGYCSGKFDACWFCGEMDCPVGGNHTGPAAEAASSRITHFDQGHGHPSCPCEGCKNMRERAARRKQK